MKKQPHITEQTKNNLRIAFWSLYAQKPIEKISIKEITELAGYNRGTFYLYYNDVYDLLHQIEEEILGKITDVLNDSLEKNDTFDLSGQMGILLDLMQTYETYAAVLLSDHGDPHFATRLKAVSYTHLRLFGIHHYIKTSCIHYSKHCSQRDCAFFRQYHNRFLSACSFAQ